MNNYRLVIQYDGSRYAGWQRQGNTGATIQARLEHALSAVLKEEIELNGSGRTDAGVHALGQTANFRTAQSPDCAQLLQQLNHTLPDDIAVLELCPANPRFHARLSAVGKTYRYTVNTSCIPDVFRRKYEYQLEAALDVERMRDAAKLLLGRHDFRGFSTGHTKKSTVRTLQALALEQQGEKLVLTFTGDGFLYNMVRILTGTLLEVGMGKRTPESVLEVFATCDRQKAGFTAPPQGLCLVSVAYPEAGCANKFMTGAEKANDHRIKERESL